MNLKIFLQKFFPYCYRQRYYQKALLWLNQIRSKILSQTPINDYLSDFGIDKQIKQTFSEEQLRIILDINTYTEFDQTFSQTAPENFFFKGTFSDQDSINNQSVQKLIKKALFLVKGSRDPAHGYSHTLRAARWGKLLYEELKKNDPALDWGVAAAAIAWHDIYRINHLGFLYNKNTKFRKILRRFFLIQDISIYSIHKQDSIGSCLMFLKQSKDALPNDLRLKIGIAILGEHKLEFLEEKIYPGIKTYKNIVLCADSLDNVSIGRWEESHRNVIARGLTDQAFLNRLIVLNIMFNIPKIKAKLNINTACELFDLIGASLFHHTATFYPDDGNFWKENAKKKNKK
ncbi:MAG: HD domain-containing protein [Patescibacteria group bacterium]